jgi:hypothetical protein
MAQYSLRIYLRRRATDNVGELSKVVQLRARGPNEAQLEARDHLHNIDWNAHFAALFADEEATYIRFWVDDRL